MNGNIGDILEKKTHAMANSNYNKQKKNDLRNSMFQIFSPKKKNSKNLLINENPKDIFKASNNINSIISKNLKSIYDENKNDINNNHNTLFENVHSLIKKNRNSNRHLYDQTLFYIQNNSDKNMNKESKNLLFSKNSLKKKFQNSQIIHSKNLLKKENIVRKSFKNTIQFTRKLDSISSDKKGDKKENEKDKIKENLKESKIGYECKTPKNRSKNKKPGFVINKKRNSSLFNNFNFNLKNPKENFESEILNGENKEFKDNSNNIDLKFKSGFKGIINNNISKNRRLSMNLFSNNSKSSSQSNSKINAPRRSVFVDSPKKNMIIPTLKQINNDITKTFLDSRIEKVKKELNEYEKNEVSEMISDLNQNKLNKKKFDNFSNVAKVSLKHKMKSNKSEQKK